MGYPLLSMVVLWFADIFGKPGRRAVAAALPDLKARFQPDFIIGNAENLAGGRGTNRKTFQEMLDLGFHGMTSGNHIWDNKEVHSLFEQNRPLIRPANYPSTEGRPCPGRGFGVFRNGEKGIFVINLLGRIFMDAVDCPFATADRILRENPTDYPIIVDMHCDATSEKYAMGFYLDGRVAAVLGSHSHVQTADERMLPRGTAYITDVGLSGSFDSVIGMAAEEVIQRFVTKRPHPYQPARENLGVSCVCLKIGENRKARSIERIRFPIAVPGLEQEKDLD